MEFLKNKHVVIALLIAPILALISYFSVDAAVSEKPHAAVPGEHYELLEKSNCRYNSGKCDLKNGDMSIVIKPDWVTNQRLRLTIESAQALDKVVSARVNELGEEVSASVMESQDDSGFIWSTEMISPDADLERFRLAVSVNETWYYGDAALKFIHYTTTTEQDFRQ